MICKQCGAEYPDSGRFCPSCGTPAPQSVPRQAQPAYQQPAPQKQQPTVQGAYYAPPTVNDPETFFRSHPQYRPLSPWAYFGLTILYAIPILGFIFLIVHSCSSANLNRRSFARSFWCGLLISVVVLLVVVLIALACGVDLSRML